MNQELLFNKDCNFLDLIQSENRVSGYTLKVGYDCNNAVNLLS